VRDDRHGRHRRAEIDRRRRPVDGFRTPDRGRFARLVEDVLSELPPSFLTHLEDTVILVEDVPDVTGASSPHGPDEVPLARYDAAPPGGRRGRAPVAAQLTLYRRPLEARATSKLELSALVREVTVLEVADHLGIDDDAIEELGWL
jgi:predicted Zn-dependent protease with MMP-like domain